MIMSKIDFTRVMSMDSQGLLGSVQRALDGCKEKSEFNAVKAVFTARAQMLGTDTMAAVAAITAAASEKNSHDWLSMDGRGQPVNCIDNYVAILEHDYEGIIRKNILKHLPEIYEDGTWRAWRDSDDARIAQHCETAYGLASDKKLRKALAIVFDKHPYDAIIERLENIPPWDGKTDYMHTWLTKWGKAEDTEYARECATIPIRGAVWRAYYPGTKIDDVLVLTGEQGAGKSAFCRMLAGGSELFGEVSTFEGKEAIEQIQGTMVCEIPEMLALFKASTQKVVKAYISRQEDRWRPAYGKYVQVDPRRCVFVGSSNTHRFLSDKTGGRRWYPVEINCKAIEDLVPHLDEAQHYIDCAFAQARDLYKAGKLSPIPDQQLLSQYLSAQAAAMDDDWREDSIRDWLDRQSIGTRTSALQLFREALTSNGEPAVGSPSKKESHEIGVIMDNIHGWKRFNDVLTIAPGYPRSRGWEKVAEM